MIKGWRTKPEWVKLEQERQAERCRMIVMRAQVRAAQEMAEIERETREQMREIQIKSPQGFLRAGFR